jgi:P27 family predicted phage terminase small subunit
VGKRGPTPAPTALKLLKGVGKHDASRVNTDEPVPAGVVAPPKWLGEDALSVWHSLAADLELKNVLKPWDCEAFAIWCDLAAKRRRISAAIDEDGMTIKVPVLDKQGELVGYVIKRNPATLIEKSLTDSMCRYGARFGLSPSDRSQLKVGDAPTTGSKADLLSG